MFHLFGLGLVQCKTLDKSLNSHGLTTNFLTKINKMANDRVAPSPLTKNSTFYDATI